ncbi:hypothetical protein T440DRAFT_474907 [Plenodomus tracheiphilus IPT5]|uniref:Nitrogen regulatory protein areA GATA-like domain-containing protein n=1 Tax=Plenodomus tracheiphilus IPT5 TaxID=1408161 RepID=A0A6A7BJE6_9PLEO|nr:hypothetical protein T440DRAFT_474907 [Plenodomus tracheiphilus IPT5]
MAAFVGLGRRWSTVLREVCSSELVAGRLDGRLHLFPRRRAYDVAEEQLFSGLWTVDCGLWTVDSTAASRRAAMDNQGRSQYPASPMHERLITVRQSAQQPLLSPHRAPQQQPQLGSVGATATASTALARVAGQWAVGSGRWARARQRRVGTAQWAVGRRPLLPEPACPVPTVEPFERHPRAIANSPPRAYFTSAASARRLPLPTQHPRPPPIPRPSLASAGPSPSILAPRPPDTPRGGHILRNHNRRHRPHVDIEPPRDYSGGRSPSEHHRRLLAVTDREDRDDRAPLSSPQPLTVAAMADVLQRQGSPFPGPIRSPSSTSLAYDSYSSLRKNPYSLPDVRSPSLSSTRTSSLHSTPSSSVSLDTRSDESSSDDDGLSFPDYGCARQYKKQASAPPLDMDSLTSIGVASLRPALLPPPSPSEALSSDTPLSNPEPHAISEDDTAVRKEPSHHVDYLSYVWREEDIWSSWRHIVEHRKVYGERSRLENASWRTWAKSQFKLKTVSPETLNWLKDVDVTWLYGPMQPASNRFCSQQSSEPASRLSKRGSFVNGVKKPILKKRSMSEAMLQKSLSTSSLLQQAADSVQAQQTTGATLELRRPRPIIGRATPDFPTSSTLSRGLTWEGTDYFTSKSTSGLQTPDLGEKKHIRFDDKVEQCIAVECKDADDDEDGDYNHNPWAKYQEEDSSSDEGVVMMKRSRKKKPLSRTVSTTSISSDNKTIARLPSTTLKSRTDSPDVTEQQSHSLGFWRPRSGLSPSPSSETLKPSNPSRNFLLAEDDEEGDDDYFDPGSAYSSKRPQTPTALDPYSLRPSDASSSESGGLRRTASGMFMPFEENEEDTLPPTLISRVVDTVNTARDIGHVIWNAAWSN